MCKQTPPGVIQAIIISVSSSRWGCHVGASWRMGVAESVSVALYTRSSTGDTEK